VEVAPAHSSTTRQGLASAGFALWVGAMLLLVEQFVTYDFGHGRARLLIALALVMVAFVGPKAFGRWWASSARATVGVAGAIVFVVFFVVSVNTTADSISMNRQAEMGQINYRAIELLRQGVNPYGTDTYLDFYRYGQVVQQDTTARCLSQTPDEAQRNFDRFWESIDADDMRDLPSVSSSDDCADARREFRMLGFKYGPALIASYLPFVLAFGERGIYVNHLVLLVALLVVMMWWARRRLGLSAILALIPLLFVVVPTLLRYDVLHDSDCDLAPALLTVSAWMLLDAKRSRTGAAVMALAIAAKAFPGLLMVPMLLPTGRRAIAWFVMTLALALLPFVASDPNGFAHNLVIFNLVRETDSTAVAHYLPDWARPLLLPLFGGVVIVLAMHAHRRQWARSSSLAYVIGAHIALFGTAKVFHNNYVVWLLPFLGLWVALELQRGAAHLPLAGSPPDRKVSSNQGAIV
jgi:hypothetical protein